MASDRESNNSKETPVEFDDNETLRVIQVAFKERVREEKERKNKKLIVYQRRKRT